MPGIRDLAYFSQMQTSLFGKPAMISRTGYTGERGYEIFCKAADAPLIWDAILEKGKAMGIIPCAFTALDWLRVESYLLFFPYDNSQMYPFADQKAGDYTDPGVYKMPPGTQARLVDTGAAPVAMRPAAPNPATPANATARKPAGGHHNH